MIAALLSIPVFAASTPMSPATASICAATTSGAISATAVTAVVFCAVIAVIAVMPYTPKTLNVLRSACMPAPPPESDPAIDSARGICMEPPTSLGRCRRAARMAGRPSGSRLPVPQSRAATLARAAYEMIPPGRTQRRAPARRHQDPPACATRDDLSDPGHGDAGGACHGPRGGLEPRPRGEQQFVIFPALERPYVGVEVRRSSRRDDGRRNRNALEI